MSHRFFDHTADIGVDLEAPDLEALFVEALHAFTDALTPPEGVGAAVERPVELSAESLEDLMVVWLEELLFLFEVEELLASGARITVERGRGEKEGGDVRLTGTVIGETYDPERHPLKVLIKGVTYHALEVEETRAEPPGWRARVIFDI